jgi:signal transduction histidine kinase
MVECEPDDEWIPFDDLYYLQDEHSGDFRSLNISLSEGLFSDETVNYYMDIYATEEFTSQFGRLMGGETTDTNGLPISISVCLGTVLVMIFTSLLFVAYDHYVRKEFNAKNQLLEAKRRFVRYVSHEVRTPLNTVCMGLTLLENDFASALEENELTAALKASLKSNHQKHLASDQNKRVGDGDIVIRKESVEEWLSLSTQVFQNADAAVGVLSDLLSYDKIQMGTLSLELSLINIWVALEKTVEEFQMAAKERNVSLAIDFSPLMDTFLLSSDEAKTDVAVEKSLSKPKPIKASDLHAKIQNCLVVADKIRLTQVFRNLISNGLKFSKEHSKCIKHHQSFCLRII